MKFLRLFLSLAVIILFCFCGATGQSSVDPDHIQDSEKLSEVTTSANQQKKASSSNLRVTYQRRLPGNEYEFGNLSAGGVGAVSGILFFYSLCAFCIAVVDAPSLISLCFGVVGKSAAMMGSSFDSKLLIAFCGRLSMERALCLVGLWSGKQWNKGGKTQTMSTLKVGH
eukprot:CAMPEP_0116823198 /NCGR_PEP_ID=MMETSP0418-20121206/708_1 /TAXON_ID=1158023 /ORGANISM="Astrosyne radiata, Strain 13vi08-1A" /LENGTH=168 /DNA_ID=CAMNT_0004451431 /DNA_START=162 /DNA_END=666 /DNA_ORIENTATION=+